MAPVCRFLLLQHLHTGLTSYHYYFWYCCLVRKSVFDVDIDGHGCSVYYQSRINSKSLLLWIHVSESECCDCDDA